VGFVWLESIILPTLENYSLEHSLYEEISSVLGNFILKNCLYKWKFVISWKEQSWI